MNTAELIQFMMYFIENQGFVIISCVTLHNVEYCKQNIKIFGENGDHTWKGLNFNAYIYLRYISLDI